MKLDSKYFDGIRVKPEDDRSLREELPECQWPGCAERAEHPAPKGRGHDGEYYHFCLEHVRQYNKSYNYFTGMSDEDVTKFQESAITGHRPTWSMGVNSWSHDGASEKDVHGKLKSDGFPHNASMRDPFGFFGKEAGESETRDTIRRPIRNMERKCLTALNLGERATASEIKSRFKDLVKRHHPDLNGGDKRSEDKLREIIQAYNYLKQSGLC